MNLKDFGGGSSKSYRIDTRNNWVMFMFVAHNPVSGNLLYGGAKKYGSGYYIWMSGTSLFDPSAPPQASNTWSDLINWVFSQKNK